MASWLQIATVVALVAVGCVWAGEEGAHGVNQAVPTADMDDKGVPAVKIEMPDNSKPEGEDRKRANQYDCYVPSLGGWKRHGEVFRLGNSQCITYRCQYGQYDFNEEACTLQSGQCIPVNSLYDYGRCSKLRCVKNDLGNYREYKFISDGSPQCEVNGRCYRFGEVFDVFCQSKRCVSNGNPGGFRIENAGYNNKCRDSNGNCWNQGQIFSDWLNGRYYNHCVCNGGSAGYQCYTYTK